MFQINHGPFKGTVFGADEACRLPADPLSGDPDKAGINLSALNQRFLDVFSPIDGWSIRFRRTLLDLDMYPLARYGEAVTEAVPCAEFTAELVNQHERVINSASSIWTIRGPTEWEKGETNARIRLYEAIGLQARFPLPDGVQLESAPEMPGGTAVAHVERKTSSISKPNGDDQSMPVFAPVVEDDERRERSFVDAEVMIDTENPLGDGPAANAAAPEMQYEPTVVAPAATTATQESSQGTSNVLQMRPPRKRKQQLPDNAPAPEALKAMAKSVAALRGMTVPDHLATKADYKSFIAQVS